MRDLRLKTSNRARVMIDDDPERAIIFNLDDPLLRDRIYKLGIIIKSKQAEVEKKIPELEAIEGKDELGAPLKDVAAHDLIVELAKFISKEIDGVFGIGTSEKLYADGFDFETTTDFVNLVTNELYAVGKNKINQRLSKNAKGKKALK